MKKHKRLFEILASLGYVILVFVIRGVYIFFSEKTSIIQAFQKSMLELTNLIIVMAIGMLFVFAFLFAVAKIRKKKGNK